MAYQSVVVKGIVALCQLWDLIELERYEVKLPYLAGKHSIW